MIPLRDTIASQRVPMVNYVIIALCGLTFLAQLREGSGPGGLSDRLGMIPARVWNPEVELETKQVAVVRTPFGNQLVEQSRPLAPSLVPAWLTPLTCIFLHGGWLHFIGNMWFLFIFGDNVEDRLGHAGYTAFYLGCGVAASVAHLLVEHQSGIPTIGASGAIAGVMGAYFFLYPGSRVVTLVPIFFFLHVMVIPAPIFLAIWFAMQFLQGVSSVTGGVASGVAWWAHIGGFAAGAGVTLLLRQLGQLNPPATDWQAAGSDSWGARRQQTWRQRGNWP